MNIFEVTLDGRTTQTLNTLTNCTNGWYCLYCHMSPTSLSFHLCTTVIID